MQWSYEKGVNVEIEYSKNKACEFISIPRGKITINHAAKQIRFDSSVGWKGTISPIDIPLNLWFHMIMEEDIEKKTTFILTEILKLSQWDGT